MAESKSCGLVEATFSSTTCVGIPSSLPNRQYTPTPMFFLQHLEEVRKSLEFCNVDKDIIEFINQKKTGSEKPGE